MYERLALLKYIDWHKVYTCIYTQCMRLLKKMLLDCSGVMLFVTHAAYPYGYVHDNSKRKSVLTTITVHVHCMG